MNLKYKKVVNLKMFQHVIIVLYVHLMIVYNILMNIIRRIIIQFGYGVSARQKAYYSALATEKLKLSKLSDFISGSAKLIK